MPAQAEGLRHMALTAYAQCAADAYLRLTVFSRLLTRGLIRTGIFSCQRSMARLIGPLTQYAFILPKRALVVFNNIPGFVWK